MNTLKKINNELAIAGQMTLEQFQQIAEDGYKSVLNLRSLDEKGFIDNEQEEMQLLGLYYIHIPTKAEDINQHTATKLFQTVTELPKPTLIHCDNAIRSAAIALLYIATKQGIEFEKIFQKTIKLGLLS